MGMCEKYINKDYAYFIFRVLVGLLFLQHGLQKLLGMFGGKSAELFSIMGLAGIIEFLAGISIALGLFARFGAFFAALQMAVAYFMAHAPKGLIPMLNMGELALLYFAAFLAIMAFGAGKWSLEKAIFKKEFF